MTVGFIKHLSFTIALLLWNICSSQVCKEADYPLDINGNDTTANALHGIVNGFPISTTDHLGNPGGALSFNGTTDYVSLPSLFDFPQRTISVWFQANTLSTTSGVLYNSDHPTLVNGNTIIRARWSNGNKLRFVVGGVYRQFPINLNQWYLATLVVDGDSAHCYIDCSLMGSFKHNYVRSQTGDGVARIAANRHVKNLLDGQVNNVKIYRCALSQSEICPLITNLKHSIKPKPLTVFPNPAGDNIKIDVQGGGWIIRITDIGGKLLINEPLSSNTINVANLPKGIYSIQVKNKDGRIRRGKVAIQK